MTYTWTELRCHSVLSAKGRSPVLLGCYTTEKKPWKSLWQSSPLSSHPSPVSQYDSRSTPPRQSGLDAALLVNYVIFTVLMLSQEEYTEKKSPLFSYGLYSWWLNH